MHGTTGACTLPSRPVPHRLRRRRQREEGCNLVEHEGSHELDSRVAQLQAHGSSNSPLVPPPDGAKEKAAGLAVTRTLHLLPSLLSACLCGGDQLCEERSEFRVHVVGAQDVRDIKGINVLQRASGALRQAGEGTQEGCERGGSPAVQQIDQR